MTMTSTYPTGDAPRASDMEKVAVYAAAMEHLTDYVDKVLEAFHTGVGVINNAPEPITVDIARRLLWTEIRRTLRNLAVDAGAPAAMVERLNHYFWLRIAGDDPILILDTLHGVNRRGTVTCTFRLFGPRREGDQVVVYAVCYPITTPAEAANILEDFKKRGLIVRDCNLGPSL